MHVFIYLIFLNLMFFHKHDLIALEKSKISYLTPPSYYTKYTSNHLVLHTPPKRTISNLFFHQTPSLSPFLPCLIKTKPSPPFHQRLSRTFLTHFLLFPKQQHFQHIHLAPPKTRSFKISTPIACCSHHQRTIFKP